MLITYRYIEWHIMQYENLIKTSGLNLPADILQTGAVVRF